MFETRRSRPHAEFMKIWEEGYVGTDASFVAMHMQGVAVFDGSGLLAPSGDIDRDRFRDTIATAVQSIPYARVRLMRSALGLTAPAWVPAGPLDLDRHVRFAEDPVPLNATTLRRLIGWEHGPLDRTAPLWRLQVTPLLDGRIAVGVLMHHSGGDALRTLSFLSSITTSRVDGTTSGGDDPFIGLHPPSAWGGLAWLALREWWDGDGSLRAKVDLWRRKPFSRRLRRVGARISRPLRRRAAPAPQSRSDYRTIDTGAAQATANALGGTLNDLLIASSIRCGVTAGSGAVRFRVPVLGRRTAEERNRVRDISVVGSRDEPFSELVLSVRAQLKGDAAPASGAEAKDVGYATLVPWLSRPRYLCGAAMSQVIVLPAALPNDELSVFCLMYAGALSVVATAPAAADLESTLDILAEDLLGGGPDSVARSSAAEADY